MRPSVSGYGTGSEGDALITTQTNLHLTKQSPMPTGDGFPDRSQSYRPARLLLAGIKGGVSN
jgi:hypothetical protein